MRSTVESDKAVEDRLLILQVSGGVKDTRDVQGIGHLVDGATIDGWLRDYLSGRAEVTNEGELDYAYRFGVRVEPLYAGRTFVDAEPEIRSEWSCERNRCPWETVRDAIWAGFDRARNRNV
jgi:hypothetical protein